MFLEILRTEFCTFFFDLDFACVKVFEGGKISSENFALKNFKVD
jgi:hypothetical protein